MFGFLVSECESVSLNKLPVFDVTLPGFLNLQNINHVFYCLNSVQSSCRCKYLLFEFGLEHLLNRIVHPSCD